MFIGVRNANPAGSRHDGRKSRQAETTFIEFGGVISEKSDFGIDNNVEWHCRALLFNELLRRHAAQQLFAVLNHRELQSEPRLWRREPDTWSVPHRLAHVPDETLYFVRNDLLAR